MSAPLKIILFDANLTEALARGKSRSTLAAEAGNTYVMMREGDPWHACHVTWMAHTRPFKIGRHVYVDCYLPKRWRKIATAHKTETRPVRISELW